MWWQVVWNSTAAQAVGLGLHICGAMNSSGMWADILLNQSTQVLWLCLKRRVSNSWAEKTSKNGEVCKTLPASPVSMKQLQKLQNISSNSSGIVSTPLRHSGIGHPWCIPSTPSWFQMKTFASSTVTASNACLLPEGWLSAVGRCWHWTARMLKRAGAKGGGHLAQLIYFFQPFSAGVRKCSLEGKPSNFLPFRNCLEISILLSVIFPNKTTGKPKPQEPLDWPNVTAVENNKPIVFQSSELIVFQNSGLFLSGPINLSI